VRREKIADCHTEDFSQSYQVFARHALSRVLVSVNRLAVNAKRLGQIVKREPKSPTLSSYTSPNMPINRRHEEPPRSAHRAKLCVVPKVAIDDVFCRACHYDKYLTMTYAAKLASRERLPYLCE
jgi:hypothetical protein